MENELKIEELFDEVLYIYDNDLDAIAIHMSYILDKMRKADLSFKKNKIPLSLIKVQLFEEKDLEKYRTVFIRILDTFKDEIEEFKKVSKLDISGISSIFYVINDITKDKNVLSKIEKRDLTAKKNEIVEIIVYLQNIIYNLENIDKVRKDKEV